MTAAEWEPSYAGLARFVRGLEPEDDEDDFEEQLSLLEDRYTEGESS